MGIQTNIYAARSLPWRKITPLHARMGARQMIFPIVANANTTVPIFVAPYGPGVIDRVIGCEVNLGGLNTSGSFTISDVNSGYFKTIGAPTLLGSYGFNLVTLDDGAALYFIASKAITAAMNCSVTLFNFELPPFEQGHA